VRTSNSLTARSLETEVELAGPLHWSRPLYFVSGRISRLLSELAVNASKPQMQAVGAKSFSIPRGLKLGEYRVHRFAQPQPPAAEPPMSMARRDVDTLELDFSLFTISIPSVDFACSDF
jgi:hypothetical protein